MIIRRVSFESQRLFIKLRPFYSNLSELFGSELQASTCKWYRHFKLIDKRVDSKSSRSGDVGVAMIDINCSYHRTLALDRSARGWFEGTDRCFDHQMPLGMGKVGRVTQMTSLAVPGAYLFQSSKTSEGSGRSSINRVMTGEKGIGSGDGHR